MTDVLPAPNDAEPRKRRRDARGGRALSLPVAAEQADASRYPFASRSGGSRWRGRASSSPATSSPATTSAATSCCGATRTAWPTSTTPTARTSAPTSATAATSTAASWSCPFHGWKFDAEGANTDIPYGTRTNQKARIGTYPVQRDRRPLHHGLVPPRRRRAAVRDRRPARDRRAPTTRDGPRVHFSVAAAHPGAGREQRRRPPLPLRAQHRDRARDPVVRDRRPHGRHAVHPAVPDAPGRGRRPHRRRQPRPRASASPASAASSTRSSSGAATPVDANRCEVRFNFKTKNLGDAETTSGVGKAFVKEVCKQFEEDRPIWENKAHIRRPALADTDPPFMKFRKWYSQFYADGVAKDGQVYAPPPPDLPDGQFQPGEVRQDRADRVGQVPHRLNGRDVRGQRPPLRCSERLARQPGEHRQPGGEHPVGHAPRTPRPRRASPRRRSRARARSRRRRPRWGWVPARRGRPPPGTGRPPARDRGEPLEGGDRPHEHPDARRGQGEGRSDQDGEVRRLTGEITQSPGRGAVRV